MFNCREFFESARRAAGRPAGSYELYLSICRALAPRPGIPFNQARCREWLRPYEPRSINHQEQVEVVAQAPCQWKPALSLRNVARPTMARCCCSCGIGGGMGRRTGGSVPWSFSKLLASHAHESIYCSATMRAGTSFIRLRGARRARSAGGDLRECLFVRVGGVAVSGRVNPVLLRGAASHCRGDGSRVFRSGRGGSRGERSRWR